MAGNSRDKKLGVVFFLPDRGGSTFYRLQQPAEKLHQNGLADICTVDMGHDPAEAVIEVIRDADVLVYLNPCGEELADNFKVIREETDKKIVVDMNDDIFCLSPFSPHYSELGLFEVKFNDFEGEETYLWQDGISAYRDAKGSPQIFSIERNRKNMELTSEILRSVDLITVTTPYLADLYAEYAPTVVLPDSVDLEIWKSLYVRYPDDSFRLGWRGGWSHYEDLVFALPALKKAMAKYPWLKFVMSGFRPKGILNQLPQGSIEIHPFIGHPAFPWHMMALGVHAAFYPWKSIPFNRGKNNLCWIEFSALGVAGVYPGLPPYSDHVVNGETGLLAVTEEGYFNCLDRIVWDRKLRRRMGRAARAEVEEKWDINKTIRKWLEAYQSLFKEDLCLSKSPDLKEAPDNSSAVLH